MTGHAPVPGYTLRGVAIGYGRRRRSRTVLDGLNATAEPGDLTVLIGPNGTGKSTLLRTLAGLQPPLAGTIRLDGADLAPLDPGDLARRLAVVLTERDLPPLLTAHELAGLGRYQHTGLTGRLTPADHEAVDRALEGVGAAHLTGRPVTELSDGERQRVLIARALAQDPTAILLDEPTAFLDVAARVTVLGLLRRLARDQGLTVVVSTHDLELALRVADQIWLITPAGHLVTGTPEQLTLDGEIGTAFNGTGLAFDPATATFTPANNSTRTATITATSRHQPLLERALTREGWQVTTDPAADLHVTWNQTAITAELNGELHHFPNLTTLTSWTRHSARP